MTAAAVGSLRCSAWARTVELDPAGTAGAYSGFLVIDQQLPWPRDVNELGATAGIADLLVGSGFRVQATVPSLGETRRVALYRREAEGRFRGFTGQAFEFTDDDVAGLRSAVQQLLEGRGAAMGSYRNVLVCTHGRRDVCCGTLGTELHARLSSTSLPDDVRLSRTSHTGGHRFAPTFIILPEATLWAFAEPELVRQVLSRDGDVSVAAGHYRGCAGLPAPRVQVLEREVLRRVGWDLFSCARSGSERGGDGSVRLEVEAPDGSLDVWEARVLPGRELPVPDCGRPIDEATKSETEWEVQGLRRL